MVPHVDWAFEIRRKAAGLQLAGELDAHTLEGLEAMLAGMEGTVRLDLSRLDFADTAAARELARLWCRGRVRLAGARRRVRRVFALLGLEGALEEPPPRPALWRPRPAGEPCRGLEGLP